MIYEKASFVIRMIQEIVGGQEVFFPKIRSYLKENLYQNVDQVSGHNLSLQYLYWGSLYRINL